MATFDEFWGRAGPGLLDLGVGLYNKRAGQKEAQRRLATAQGPLYRQATGAAGNVLSELGMLDADALAGKRFAAQEELLAGPQAKDEADLMRMLYSKGLLGVANYNPNIGTYKPGAEYSPSAGITPDGTAMNPHMAAFYAARNADRAKRATGALDEGQKFASGMLDRAGALQRIGGDAQTTGLAAQRTQPSKSAANAEILRGLGGMILKDPKIVSDIFSFGKGMLGGMGDWLNGGSFLGGYDAGLDFVW